jgi:2-polyprenyl-3-methyl-5-hydroxy-6-metoxy-1,4-benzoquinol methylase
MQNHNIKCPISPDHPVELREEINTKDLIWLYRQYHEIDISEEFNTPHLHLVYNSAMHFYFFYPLVGGSAGFYQQLYKHRGYHLEKQEFKWSAAFVKPGDRVLDVGCGWGAFQNYVPFANYRGLEPNEEAAQEGRRKGANVDTLAVEDLARSSETYDVVVLFQVLEHIVNPLDFFRACTQCVKADGLLIVSVPNLNSYMSMRENVALNMPPHHVSWWSLRTLIKLGLKENLSLVDYHEEKEDSLSNFSEAFFKAKFNDLCNRKPKHIRRGSPDLILNKGLNYIGRYLKKPPFAIAPNGHSITVAFKKNL